MRQTIFILIAVLCFIISGHTQQGNYKFNKFGNRSILLSGNVTGSVTDLGLVYYNPSRLTEVSSNGFAFNARAYQIASLKLSNVLGEESKLNSINFNGLPSMAGGTFEVFNNRFAYSFISKSRMDNSLGYTTNEITEDVLANFPDVASYRASVLLNTAIIDDWFGLTWAKKVNENLSLGVSFFGSIYNYRGGSNINQTVQSINNNVSFFQNTIGFDQESYGLLIKTGANYHFPKFDVGLNVNLPYIEVYEEGRFLYTTSISGEDPTSDRFYDYDLKNLSTQRKEPLAISIGAGIPVRRSTLHLNIDYVKGLQEFDRIEIPSIDIGQETLNPVLFKESRKQVINFGAGLEIYVSKNVKLYGSFTSDYNAFIKNANIFDLATIDSRDVNIGENFFHYSMGVDLKLNWVSLVLGVNYTSSSTEFISPLGIPKSGGEYEDYTKSTLEYSRWQFVVGVEIPANEKSKIKEL